MAAFTASSTSKLSPLLATPGRNNAVVKVHAKEQKNQGLYFEYERVDPEQHKQLPVEKARVQTEFSWVKRARQGPLVAPPPGRNQQNKNKSASKQNRSATTTGAVKDSAIPNLAPRPAQRALKPVQTPSPDSSTEAAAEQHVESTASVQAPPSPASTASPQVPDTLVADAFQGFIDDVPSSKPQTTAAAAVTASAAVSRQVASAPQTPPPSQAPPSSAASSSQSGSDDTTAVNSRKQRLLQRMSGPVPSPAPSSTPVPSAEPGSVVVAAAAAAATVAASTSGKAAATVPAAAAMSAASLQLPQLPPAMDASNLEEQQVRSLLAGLLQIDPDELAGLDQDGQQDLATLSAQQDQGLSEFNDWLQQVRTGQQGTTSQASSSTLTQQAAAAAADDAENDAVLGDAASIEAEVSKLLAQGGAELSELKDLFGLLAGGDAEDDDKEPTEIPEDQLLAMLKESDPELYKLLAPGDGLDFTAEDEEVERAIASLSRLGLDRDTSSLGQDEEDADSADLPADLAAISKSLNQSDAALLGLDQDRDARSKIEAEEDLFDEEELAGLDLEDLARSDPDIAALLRSNSLGRDFEKLVDGDDAEDEAELGVEDNVEFSDLFDALDEDPELDDEDRKRARYELQSMFNAPGQAGDGKKADKPFVVTRGLTTTGRPDAGGDGDVPPPLLQRPARK